MRPTISVEEMARRARERCRHHRRGVGGLCRDCLLAEVELALAEHHPEMKPGDPFELSQHYPESR